MKPLNYENAMNIAKSHKVHLLWDAQAKVYFAIHDQDWLNEYLFIEDKKSFKFKYSLIKKYQLRGVSVFDLGTEDPRIWKVLPKQLHRNN